MFFSFERRLYFFSNRNWADEEIFDKLGGHLIRDLYGLFSTVILYLTGALVAPNSFPRSPITPHHHPMQWRKELDAAEFMENARVLSPQTNCRDISLPQEELTIFVPAHSTTQGLPITQTQDEVTPGFVARSALSRHPRYSHHGFDQWTGH